MMHPCPYGFRIVGGTWEARRLVDAAGAFAGYAACDSRAETDKEAYLSAFQFDEDFRGRTDSFGNVDTKNFSGPCWSPWLWFDIDVESNLRRAYREAARLGMTLYERYKPADDVLLIFFSGSKGFHIGLPTALWAPAPSIDFHKTARRFAENVAAVAQVTIDPGVYDKVRAFRAPNSRHPKTGLHKRRFTLDEFINLSLDRIVELSREPAPFDILQSTGTNEQAAADWSVAIALVKKEGEAKEARRANVNSTSILNRGTLDFIRHGADQGDRHRLLFSAAANLAEFGCPPALAFALLEESALDSGLSPKDVRRQIDCGLSAVVSPTNFQSLIPNPEPLPPDPPRLLPLPPGAVGSGTLDKPCCCGSTEYVDIAISEGRIRRDCRTCGKFIDWAKWYDKGGKQ